VHVGRGQLLAQELRLGGRVETSPPADGRCEQDGLQLHLVENLVDRLHVIAPVDELEAGPADLGRGDGGQRALQCEISAGEEGIDLLAVVALGQSPDAREPLALPSTHVETAAS
jgi:hypothetical protein